MQTTMPGHNPWTEIMVAVLDRHFPCNDRFGTSACSQPDRLRLRFERFAREVDEWVMATGTGHDLLEWRVTSTILRALAKRTRRLAGGRATNCLNAFGPHIDRFAWAVYMSRFSVREAVEIWCHRLGWRHVYVVTSGEAAVSSGATVDGLCLLGLCLTPAKPGSGRSYGPDLEQCNRLSVAHYRAA